MKRLTNSFSDNTVESKTGYKTLNGFKTEEKKVQPGS